MHRFLLFLALASLFALNSGVAEINKSIQSWQGAQRLRPDCELGSAATDHGRWLGRKDLRLVSGAFVHDARRSHDYDDGSGYSVWEYSIRNGPKHHDLHSAADKPGLGQSDVLGGLQRDHRPLVMAGNRADFDKSAVQVVNPFA